ncbi:MAG: hypothetical protein AVDCRST_MAG11-550 [uncultured Gemmatimonadaceae bacterium]|uniref:Uncharacterized protein n=1 Tax=uncultured Gemmatimonadaceae bacterium TaxID=246130 RepID=A0A6J4K6B5_9BACT|nr:MAG: hypothetical protein AVDCRST_MAG11-550 [uncultured Gemmatimonadaceae bacterium]
MRRTRRTARQRGAAGSSPAAGGRTRPVMRDRPTFHTRGAP